MTAIELLWKIRQTFSVSLSMSTLHLPLVDVVLQISKPSYPKIEPPSANEKRMTSICDSRPSKVIKSDTIEIAEVLQWRGRGNVGEPPKPSLFYENFPKPFVLGIKWKFKCLKCVDSSAVYIQVRKDFSQEVEEYVLIGSHGGDLHCLQADTGLPVWSIQLGGHIEGAVASHASKAIIFCTYFVANDFHGSDSAHPSSDLSREKGGVVAINMPSGNILWELPLPGEVKSSPLLLQENNSCWIGTYDDSILILESLTGSKLGRIEVKGSIYSPLVYNSTFHTVLAATTQGYLYTIHASTFEIQWSRSIDSSPLYSTPLFLPDNLVVLGTVAGNLYCLQHETGDTLWRTAFPKPIFSSPHLVSSAPPKVSVILVGCHDGYLRGLNTLNGEIIWSTNLNSIVFSSPTSFNYSGSNITNEGNNNVENTSVSSTYAVVTTTAGRCILLETLSGEVKASIDLAGEVYSSPVTVVLRDSNALVFVGCRDDYLYALSFLEHHAKLMPK